MTMRYIERRSLYLREAGDNEPEQLCPVVMLLLHLCRGLCEPHPLLPDELAAVQPGQLVHLVPRLVPAGADGELRAEEEVAHGGQKLLGQGSLGPGVRVNTRRLGVGDAGPEEPTPVGLLVKGGLENKLPVPR